LVQDETSSSIKQFYMDELRGTRELAGIPSSNSINTGSNVTVPLTNSTSSVIGNITNSIGGGCGGKVSAMSYVNVMNAEMAYQKKAESLLNDQNCYKIISYKNSCRLTLELMDTNDENESDDNEAATTEVEKWSEYVENYCNTNVGDECTATTQLHLMEQLKKELLKRPVFLTRSAHYLKCKYASHKKKQSDSTVEKQQQKQNDSEKTIQEVQENFKEECLIEKSKEAISNNPTSAEVVKINKNEPSKDRSSPSDSALNSNNDILKIEDNSIYKLTADSYKLKYCKESFFMYRRNTLRKSRKASLKKLSDFI
jgi:hypothetical protein